MGATEIIATITFFIIVIAVIVLVIVTSQILDIINVRELSLEDKVLKSALYKASLSEAKLEFDTLGKPIYTKKGNYRVDFTKILLKKQVDLQEKCLSISGFNEDFCTYVETNYQQVSASQLDSIILSYTKYSNYSLYGARNADGSLTPKEFFQKKYTQNGEVVGVYVLHNKTKGLVYVGQAKRIYFRVNQHLTGHGNGDVYADYKYGDEFTVRLIKLSDSGYDDIDKLEKDMIRKYDAYNNGYNKTRGNKG